MIEQINNDPSMKKLRRNSIVRKIGSYLTSPIIGNNEIEYKLIKQLKNFF